MESKLPEFKRIEDALKRNAPFKLARNAQMFNVTNIPEDKWHLIHDALLLNSFLGWHLKSEQDLRFLSSVIRDHPCLVTALVEFGSGLSQSNMAEFAAAVGSGSIRQLSIRKAPNANINDVLRACQYTKLLQKITIFFDIQPEECEPLACALKNESLIHLTIFGEHMPAEFWTPVVPVLSAHKSMKVLELWGYGPNGYQELGEILGTNRSILDLTLSYSPLSSATSKEMEKLVAGLKINTTLEKLSLHHLGPKESDLIGEALGHNQIRISELNINKAQFSENSARAFGESLKTNTCLTALELHFCELDDAKYQLFSDGLAHNSTLKLLATTNNSGLVGIQPLCTALKNHKSLTALDLTRAGVNDEQCKFIADLLVHNTVLRSLHLMSNTFQDEGVKYICDALLKNTSLHELNIGDMKFGVDGMTGVKKMLVRNTTLRKMEIYCDPESANCIELFCEGLKYNTTINNISINQYEFLTQDALRIKLMTELEHNYVLDQIAFESSPFEPILTRNRQLKSEAQFKVAILSHNIARSHQALATLPRELWIKILSHVTHPGANFETVVNTIFHSYITH